MSETYPTPWRTGLGRERETSSSNLQTNEEERSVELDRVIFFSDAVMAIAITLLVLDIRVPPRPENLTAGQSFGYISQIWGRVFYYVLSFVVVGNYWIVHHRIFSYIRRVDHRLMWLNLFFLMSIAFVPVPTVLLGEYGDLPVGPVVYAATLTIAGICVTLIWWYATHNRRLVDPNLDGRLVKLTLWRSLGATAVYLLSIPVALFLGSGLAEISWLLIFIPTGLTGRRLRALGVSD